MFKRVLIANRGAIATRIIRTLHALGIEAVAVYHEKDRHSLHVQQADIAIALGGGSVADTYLSSSKLLKAARDSGAEAVHPGYGFLSENPDFVDACTAEGLVFIGPTAEQMRLFGLKHEARRIAEAAGVPLVPGSPALPDLASARDWAAEIGFPVMLKSSAGGGGIGMQVCRNDDELAAAWDSVRRQSASYFSNDTVLLEQFVENARHIEVQIIGDGRGGAIAIGERDCSAQRRNQKVIEECPAPNLSPATRDALLATAKQLMSSVQYRNAGTVEFIYDVDREAFYFLEVNARLQVEHGVTEAVYDIDLVALMLRLAAGEIQSLDAIEIALRPKGHAIQARVYAEDTANDFLPSAGLLSEVVFPQMPGLRIDTWIAPGLDVPALFDPMLAKVIGWGESRDSALTTLTAALEQTRIYGIETNLRYVASVLSSADARRGTLLTRSLKDHTLEIASLRILSSGTQTTVQDYPGRQGYWHVGVPPSGPMDSLAFRHANQLVGNPPDAAGLEMTLTGPTLRFSAPTRIALTGAAMRAELDGEPLPRYQTVAVSAGQCLTLGAVDGAGARAYLAVAGGIECPAYLGSKATFTLGQFGGHCGRALRAGDVLHIGASVNSVDRCMDPLVLPEVIPLRVIYGPHGAPDFFDPGYIDTFFSTEWRVHYNSSRTGVRLKGPKPVWARESGGEAGLHPSNIHDNAYAFGAIDFTGDMPVILGPDGPSLGGFVCPATVISADLWKLGQLAADQRIRFVPVSHEEALAAEQAANASVAAGSHPALTGEVAGRAAESAKLASPVLDTLHWDNDAVVFRIAGDHFLLIEVGPLQLDLRLRFKVHALMEALAAKALPGVRELTPGIRSLQVHYDSQQMPLTTLLKHIADTVTSIDTEHLAVASRVVHLPLSWDDEACQLAIDRYMQAVRADAPWCPSNLEFIRRMNGLDSIEAVKQIVFSADYLVMGLGDVYLGAPVATPLDPRHRLVTTKYNPARTWTAENSVGIGGAYLCVYGMEGPGGYQFVGRTAQMWNRYQQTAEFTEPWLLRFFDRIRFYEVSSSELQEIREGLPRGQVGLTIEEGEFSLKEYETSLAEHQAEIAAFTRRREQAFAEELERWRISGQLSFDVDDALSKSTDNAALPADAIAVESPVSGSVWQVFVRPGDAVALGQTVMILESMKMEIPVLAPAEGTITALQAKPGQEVQAGGSLLWLTQPTGATHD